VKGHLKKAGRGLAILWLVLAAAGTAHAAQRRLNIKSAHDQFNVLVKSPTSGSVDGKAAVLRSLADLWPVLDNPLGNECPRLSGQPDAVVTENGKSRSLYVKQGIVTDGKFCMNVAGDGLYFFPLHRDFLIGKSRDSLPLKSPLKVFRQGTKILNLKKDGGKWVNENQNPGAKDQLLNWDFIERLENSLRDFDVRLRVQSEIAQGKPKMIIQSGDQTLEFFKITKVMWAAKKPGYAWLIASDDWSFWYDFEPALIEDRHTPEIRAIGLTDTPLEQRKSAMERLEGAWSRNLRDLYHQLLKNPSEDPDLQRTALNRLKRKPSLETSGVMVQFLNESSDEDLKRIAGQILKAHYPQGPLYKPTLPASEKAKALEFWNNWWNNTQKEN